MKYSILANGNLMLSIDKSDQKLLRTIKEEQGDEFQSDRTMQDWFDGLIGNSCFEWVHPEYVGALTSAPMLGIYGPDTPLEASHEQEYNRIVGYWDDKTWYAPVKYAWAYMDYQVRSPLEDLMEQGYCIWQAATDRPWVEIECNVPGSINHTVIATNPEKALLTGRNGTFSIRAVDVFMCDTHVTLQGVSDSKGTKLNGGMCFMPNTMDELCRQWMEFRQQQQQQR